MARARNIKPSFFTNEQLADCDPLARILFVGLWCLADRAGRLENRARRIKAMLLPYDDADVNHLLAELSGAGVIQLYAVNGSSYIQVLSFEKHQHPHVKEPESTIPAPDLTRTNLGEPGNGQDQSGAKTSESLLPLSDSLTLSPNGDASRKTQAKEILAFLNERTGKHYRDVESNITLIAARLKEGATPDECRAVIARLIRQWGKDEKMEPYLRPATIFGKQNFWQKYHGELGKGG